MVPEDTFAFFRTLHVGKSTEAWIFQRLSALPTPGARVPPRGPGPPAGAVEHCALCRKTFTSKAQLLEHEGGKWHALRVRGELPPSRRPYNA